MSNELEDIKRRLAVLEGKIAPQTPQEREADVEDIKRRLAKLEQDIEARR